MTPEKDLEKKGESKLEDETLNWMREALQSFFVWRDSLRRYLEDLALKYLSGEDILPQLLRMTELPWFGIIGNLLRAPRASFDELLNELELPGDQAQFIREMWLALYPVLEDPLDAAFAARSDSIANTWTNIESRAVYITDGNLLMLDLQVMRGLDQIYSTQDRLESIFQLGNAILNRCGSALQQANEHGLRLQERQVSALAKRLERLQKLVPLLSSAIESLASKAAVSESGINSGETSESGSS